MEASHGTNEMDLGFAITKFTDVGFGFAVGEPLSSEDASCLLFDVALCTLCFRFERNCCQKTSTNPQCSTNEEDDSIHRV